MAQLRHWDIGIDATGSALLQPARSVCVSLSAFSVNSVTNSMTVGFSKCSSTATDSSTLYYTDTRYNNKHITRARVFKVGIASASIILSSAGFV